MNKEMHTGQSRDIDPFDRQSERQGRHRDDVRQSFDRPDSDGPNREILDRENDRSAKKDERDAAQERDFAADDPRFTKGMEMLAQVDGAAGTRVLESLHDICPDLGYHIVAWGFGDIYSRETLRPRDRQLVTLGMLTALGGCEQQLEVHIGAALNVGLSPEEIVEALLHSAVYCGFPRSLNAMFVAKRIFAQRGLLPLKADAAPSHSPDESHR